MGFSGMVIMKEKSSTPTTEVFSGDVRTLVGSLETEIAERNSSIRKLDSYIYGDLLKKELTIPMGHDITPVNWLNRTIAIQASQFIGKGLQVLSTYDLEDVSNASDDKDKKRRELENKKRKANSESRRRIIDSVIRDNGGQQLFKDLAENAGAIGDSVVKVWFDTKEKKVKIVPVESVENFRVYWSDSNFREIDFVAYVWQVTESKARSQWSNLPDTLQLTRRGYPLELIDSGSSSRVENNQAMVTVMEITGKVPGWKSEKGELQQTKLGRETLLNATIVGGNTVKVIDKKELLPRYYVLPNKRQRRRAWGKSDITEGAIRLNQAFIETLSDWRTVGFKVNFPKYKGYGFGPTQTLPKPKPRTIELIPLGQGQDIVELPQGDSKTLEFKAQMEEIKNEYVKEVAISRVLFDDPKANSDSNQALMTTMKNTIDHAQSKRTLWAPIISEMFTDILHLISKHVPEAKDILDEGSDWHLYVQYPSVLHNEDPLYQQYLINRWNSGTMSYQTFLEKQGESPEESDRMRDELGEMVSASIVSKTLPTAASLVQGGDQPKGPDVKINLRGDLSPNQEANIASQQGFNDGPFPASAGPQGAGGLAAQENKDNTNFVNGSPFSGGTPVQRGPDGKPVNSTPVQGPQSGNQPGQGVVSQPGSGASSTSPQGSIDQNNQNRGN